MRDDEGRQSWSFHLRTAILSLESGVMVRADQEAGARTADIAVDRCVRAIFSGCLRADGHEPHAIDRVADRRRRATRMARCRVEYTESLGPRAGLSSRY